MLRKDILEKLVRPYGISAEEIQFVSHSQSFVYSGMYQGNKCIIRITTGRYRTMGQIEAELAWILYLKTQGINACAPIPADNGELCPALEIEGEIYHVTCFEHAPGRAIVRGEIDQPLLEKLGILVGRMHAAAVSFSARHVPLARPQWYESRLLREDIVQLGPYLTAKFRNSVGEMIGELRLVPQTQTNFGLIHADVSFGNCFVHNGELSIFDFDNCEHGYFLQDLVTVLYDTIYCKELRKFADPELTGRVLPLWKSVISGYAKTGPLRGIDPHQLKTFFLLREAVIYVHYLRILDPSKFDESFKSGLEVMRQNIESRSHQLDFSGFQEVQPSTAAPGKR